MEHATLPEGMESTTAIQFTIPKGTSRRSYLAGIETGLSMVQPHDNLISIVMPCGASIVYKTAGEVPVVDVACSCGREGHWNVRWVETE